MDGVANLLCLYLDFALGQPRPVTTLPPTKILLGFAAQASLEYAAIIDRLGILKRGMTPIPILAPRHLRWSELREASFAAAPGTRRSAAMYFLRFSWRPILPPPIYRGLARASLYLTPPNTCWLRGKGRPASARFFQMRLLPSSGAQRAGDKTRILRQWNLQRIPLRSSDARGLTTPECKARLIGENQQVSEFVPFRVISALTFAPARIDD